MELRLWPESWEIITVNFLLYYVQFICKHCYAVCATHPLSIAVWHLPLHASNRFCFVCPSHVQHFRHYLGHPIV